MRAMSGRGTALWRPVLLRGTGGAEFASCAPRGPVPLSIPQQSAGAGWLSRYRRAAVAPAVASSAPKSLSECPLCEDWLSGFSMAPWVTPNHPEVSQSPQRKEPIVEEHPQPD